MTRYSLDMYVHDTMSLDISTLCDLRYESGTYRPELPLRHLHCHEVDEPLQRSESHLHRLLPPRLFSLHLLLWTIDCVHMRPFGCGGDVGGWEMGNGSVRS